jgi:uronate dehydrogenase
VRVLVTGACGGIGTAFTGLTEPGGQLELVRSDLHDRAVDSPWPFVTLDVTDPEACVEACRGIDGVVHLAADPDPDADLRTRVLPLNVLGTINVFDAAVAAGVSRVVFASSGQVVIGHGQRGVPEHAPPRPTNHYGAGKAFGEALCASYAATSTTTFVALRIGAFAASPDLVEPAHRSGWLSHRDAAQIIAGIFSHFHFHTFDAVISPARKLLLKLRIIVRSKPSAAVNCGALAYRAE